MYVYEAGGLTLESGSQPVLAQTLLSSHCPGDFCSGNDFGAALAAVSFSDAAPVSSDAHTRARRRLVSEILVVGAPGAARAAGEAHVFERSADGVWHPTKVLFAPALPGPSAQYPPVHVCLLHLFVSLPARLPARLSAPPSLFVSLLVPVGQMSNAP